MSDYAGQPTAPKQESIIETKTRSLDIAISALEEEMRSLKIRLLPVSRPLLEKTAAGTGTADVPATSPMTNVLTDFHRRVSFLTGQLREAQEALDV